MGLLTNNFSILLETIAWSLVWAFLNNLFIDPVAHANGDIDEILMNLVFRLSFIISLIYRHATRHRPLLRRRVTLGDIAVEHARRFGGPDWNWADVDLLIPALHGIDIRGFTLDEFDQIVQLTLELLLLEHQRRLLERQWLQSQDLLEREKRELQKTEKLVAELRELNEAQN